MIPLPDNYEGDVRYHIQGLAFWGAGREYGPNMGTIDGVAIRGESNEFIYSRSFDRGEPTVTTLVFPGDGTMLVTEENWIGEYGMNVSFQGAYQRTT